MMFALCAHSLAVDETLTFFTQDIGAFPDIITIYGLDETSNTEHT